MKRLLPPLIAALAVAGCGAQAEQTSSADRFKGDERAVAQKVEDLQEAGESRKPEDICSQILASALVQELEAAGVDCADEMEKAIDDADDYDLDVREVNIAGSTATVTVRRGEDGPTETMEFTKENGQWRATALSGS
jgi:outer membrane PBP1 activator LpoA protein